MNCKNCDQLIEGHYCAHCGQSTKVDKINLASVLNQLSESVFQINRGFFYSLKELFVRPGHSIKDYLIGKRKNHFAPIAYALTLSTVYFLLSQLTDSQTFIDDFLQGFNTGVEERKSGFDELAILKWFANNYAITILMLLPIFSLASYISFEDSGYNYFEHVVLNAYITGQQAIFYSFFSILSLVFNNEDLLVLSTLCISISYVFFVFWQFFSEQSRVQVVIRSIVTYVLYIMMLVVVLLALLFLILNNF